MHNDYLMHHGVKGMKWGIRKDYRPTSIRSALARRSNAKVDKGFQKWNKGANDRENAINAGKKANASRMAYELDKTNKDKKAQYKQDKKDYKKALRKNTTYRKGTVRSEVGKDLSRKYMKEKKVEARKLAKELKSVDKRNEAMRKAFNKGKISKYSPQETEYVTPTKWVMRRYPDWDRYRK